VLEKSKGTYFFLKKREFRKELEIILLFEWMPGRVGSSTGAGAEKAERTPKRGEVRNQALGKQSVPERETNSSHIEKKARGRWPTRLEVPKRA